jgi:hypothetical protein
LTVIKFGPFFFDGCDLQAAATKLQQGAWALPLVCILQFGAALCAGHVNGCKIVQEPALRQFAGTVGLCNLPAAGLFQLE